MSRFCSRKLYLEFSILLLATSLVVPSISAQNYSLRGQGYTAQRKPRVAVMKFNDTNTSAIRTRYGPSVSAMLVTFLKTKSQFVVVERQNIDKVLQEWKNNQNGLTNLNFDKTQSELLEKLDVILMGNVTVLASGIEVDAKLLSRVDGRIIAAAERSGPISCLRQVVDRVGVAIEQGFLKPYYGSLRVSLDAPENSRIYLTPILSERALDEEKPPVELGLTIHPGGEQDKARHWVTNPTTYTIENILSGWYTLRVERPGYEGREISNAFFEVRTYREETRARHLTEGKTIKTLEAMGAWRPGAPEWKKYLVHVDPLKPNAIDGTARDLNLRKKNGRLHFTVLDEDARPVSGARVSLVSRDLDLNPESPDTPVELEDGKEAGATIAEVSEITEPRELSREIYEGALERRSTQATVQSSAWPRSIRWYPPAAEGGIDAAGAKEEKPLEGGLLVPEWVDESTVGMAAEPAGNEQGGACEFLVYEEIPSIDHGRRLVRANGTFDLEIFEGGLLAFESYRGEPVPEGTYEAFVWAPNHKLRNVSVHVDDGIEPQNITIRLSRKEQDLLLRGRSENLISFFGKTTGYERSVPLDVATGEKLVKLPVDRYRMDTDVIGFRSWLEELNLLPANEVPPALEDLLPPDAAERLARQEPSEELELRIKNRVWVAGRFEDFRRHPGVFYDRRTSDLLDVILGDPTSYDWHFELEDEENDHLRELEERLRDVDLLILNEDDMSFIRILPELEAVIRRFVDGGRALMAFVTWEGDYGTVLGAPLVVKRRTSQSSKLKLRPGQVAEFETRFKVDLGSVRSLPKTRHQRQSIPGWRILSYTKKGRKPRVIERGSLDRGGYVMVWFESAKLRTDPRDFASRGGIWGALGAVGNFFGGRKEQKVRLDGPEIPVQGVQDGESLSKRTRKKLERELWVSFQALVSAREANRDILMAKSMLKNRALLWAEYLMYREFDTEEEKLLDAQHRLVRAGAR